MKKVEVSLSDAAAARLEAAAAAVDVPAAGFAAVLLAEALEARLFGGDSAPQPGVLPAAVPEVGGGGDIAPQAVARAPLTPTADTDDPDTATVVALARTFLRGDMVGAAVILESVPLPALLACAMAWFNAEGIREHGRDGWDARLVAFLAEAARRRAG